MTLPIFNSKTASDSNKSLNFYSSIQTAQLIASLDDSGKDLIDLSKVVSLQVNLAVNKLTDTFPDFDFLVDLSIHPSLPKISINTSDFIKVLHNLLHNAFYSIYQKAQRIDSGFQPKINISIYQFHNDLVLSIRDNGEGIDPDILTYLFHPSFTTKAGNNIHSDIHLATCRKIIGQDHKGAIEVGSQFGKWCEFRVKLPIKNNLTKRPVFISAF